MPWTGMVRVSALLRLWLVLAATQVLLRIAFDLLVRGWIDARPLTLLQGAVVALGQAVVVTMIAGRRAETDAAGR